uniref:Uncharacterized protein n=1 Tax=Panagrolaimus davidi TaxID=227884 RepID=A0A914QHH0_9BILA
MSVAEFVFCEEENVVKKFPPKGLTPAVLAQVFKLEEASMNILSDEGDFSLPDGSAFNPPLSATATKFTIYGTRIFASIVTPAVQRDQSIGIAAPTLRKTISRSETKKEIDQIITNTCDIRRSVQLLSSAPQTCLLLDSVQILMSCTQDVKLEIDTKRYKCLNESTTLKAALLRCCNEICDTFFHCGLAMTNMQNLSSSLPQEFINIMSVFADPTKPELQIILDLSCENIREASDELVKISTEITNKVEHARTHLTEIIEVAIETELSFKTKEEETSKLINTCKEKKAELQSVKSFHIDQYKAQLNHRDVVYSTYNKQIIGYQSTYAESVFRATGDALSEMNEAISAIINSTAAKVKEFLPFNTFAASIEARDVSEKSLLALLATIRNEGLEDFNKLDQNITRYIIFLKVHLEYNPNTKAGKEAKNLAAKLLHFLKKLGTDFEAIKPSEMLNNEPFKTELKEFKAVMDAVLSILNEVKENLKAKEVAKKDEVERKRLAKEKGLQHIAEAKKYALDLAKENYEKENEKAEEFRKKLNEDQEIIMKLAAEMASLNLETLDLGNFADTGNEYLLPIIVKIMMNACGRCIQFGHCAEIYAEISSKHVMPIMNDVACSIVLDKKQAQVRQSNLQKNLKKIKADVEYLIKNRVEKNEKTEVPKILEAFATNCYQSMSIDFDVDAEANMWDRMLGYLK